MLEKAGFAREKDRTPREYALEVCLQRPGLSVLLELAELHYRSRYAPGGLSPTEVLAAEKSADSLRTLLGASRR
jgi:hypothetical protein